MTTQIEDTARREARTKLAIAVHLLIGQPGMSTEDQVAHLAKARQLTGEAFAQLGQALSIKMEKAQQAIAESALFAQLEDGMPSFESILSQVEDAE